MESPTVVRLPPRPGARENLTEGERAMKKAFTLIELLIVVAIIAILAAIAVPNFLEAQVRSKVSRVHADMRSTATALEMYRMDFGHYPLDIMAEEGVTFGPFPPGPVPAGTVANPFLIVVTTPRAYMTSIPRDSFGRRRHGFWNPTGADPPMEYWGEAWINARAFWDNPPWNTTNPVGSPDASWVLFSLGPDQRPSGGANMAFGEKHFIEFFADGVLQRHFKRIFKCFAFALMSGGFYERVQFGLVGSQH